MWVISLLVHHGDARGGHGVPHLAEDHPMLITPIVDAPTVLIAQRPCAEEGVGV
jgi:hypothetical protein